MPRCLRVSACPQWSPAGQKLASGGNDGAVAVWDRRAAAAGPELHISGAHRAAVRALAWSPHQEGLLASGGGTADKHIRYGVQGRVKYSVDNGKASAVTPFHKARLTVRLRQAGYR